MRGFIFTSREVETMTNVLTLPGPGAFFFFNSSLLFSYSFFDANLRKRKKRNKNYFRISKIEKKNSSEEL